MNKIRHLRYDQATTICLCTWECIHIERIEEQINKLIYEENNLGNYIHSFIPRNNEISWRLEEKLNNDANLLFKKLALKKILKKRNKNLKFV